MRALAKSGQKLPKSVIWEATTQSCPQSISRGAGDHEGQGGSLVLEGNQWQRGRRHPLPLNFRLSENLPLVRNFSSKNAKFEAEKHLFWGNLDPWSSLSDILSVEILWEIFRLTVDLL